MTLYQFLESIGAKEMNYVTRARAGLRIAAMYRDDGYNLKKIAAIEGITPVLVVDYEADWLWQNLELILKTISIVEEGWISQKYGIRKPLAFLGFIGEKARDNYRLRLKKRGVRYDKVREELFQDILGRARACKPKPVVRILRSRKNKVK